MKDFLLHMVTVICAETPKSAENIDFTYNYMYTEL